MRRLVVLALVVAAVNAAENEISNENILRAPIDRLLPVIQRLQVAAPKYNPGRYEAGRYDPGRYDPGRYDPNKYNTGKYDPSKYDGQGKYNPDNSGAYNGDRGDRGGAYDGGYGDRGDRGGPGGFYDGDRGDRGGPGGFYTPNTEPIFVIDITEAPPTPEPKVSQYYDYRYAIDSDEYDNLYKKVILTNDLDNAIVGKGFFDYVLPDKYKYRTDYIADSRLYF